LVVQIVVVKGAKAGVAEVQTGVEGGPDDDVEGSLRGEKDAGLDQEAELPFGL